MFILVILKTRKIFLKINDTVKYLLKKRTISRPHVIPYPISNDNTIVNFDDVIRGVKTEIRQKVLLQVSISELHIYMFLKTFTGFYMAYDYNGNFRISDYDFWLIIPPQLRKMNQRHKVMCGCKTWIQNGTYQESLNHWRKLQLRYIKNHPNSLTRGSVEKLNAENIFSIYSDVVLPDWESINPHAKYSVFFSMCEFTENISSVQICHVC